MEDSPLWLSESSDECVGTSTQTPSGMLRHKTMARTRPPRLEDDVSVDECRPGSRNFVNYRLDAYFTPSLDEREGEAEPRDNMIGWLVTTEVDGHRLGRDEPLGVVSLLMIRWPPDHRVVSAFSPFNVAWSRPRIACLPAPMSKGDLTGPRQTD